VNFHFDPEYISHRLGEVGADTENNGRDGTKLKMFGGAARLPLFECGKPDSPFARLKKLALVGKSLAD
jgi:hypothetical protein